MSFKSINRAIHRWLMLFLTIQFFIWSLSGLYMVMFNLDYIHGDSLVIDETNVINLAEVNYSLGDLYRNFSDIDNVELSSFMNKTVYRFTDNSAEQPIRMLLDASNGKVLSPLTKVMAERVARYYYHNDEKVVNSELIETIAPIELNPHHLPVWQVEFDHYTRPTLYISVESGRVVTRRHLFWRIFDWMFSFHVMDYQDEDASNQLLFWFTLTSLIAAISGLFLTYFSLVKSSKRLTT